MDKPTSFSNLFRPAQKPEEQRVHAPTPVFVGDNRVLLRNVWGLKMFVDSRDLSVSPHLILDGYWELWNSHFLRWILKPGHRFLEVGANLGYFTLLASQLVGASGKVTAVEANPRMAKITRDNLNINGFLGFAKVVEAAAYSERTKLKFSVLRDHMAGSSLFIGDSLASSIGDAIQVIEVEGLPLDELIPPGERVDLLKIDAEGSELHCLRGATRILDENPNLMLLLEHAPSLVSGDGSTSKTALYDFCVSRGMYCYRVAENAQLVESNFEALEAFGLCDIVCTRTRF